MRINEILKENDSKESNFAPLVVAKMIPNGLFGKAVFAAGYDIAVKKFGKKAADSLFYADEDFKDEMFDAYKKLQAKTIKEDWGSSDWTALFKVLGQELSGGSSLRDAAASTAEIFHDQMGYDFDDAIDVIVNRWESIGKERQSKYLTESEHWSYYTDKHGNEWKNNDEYRVNLTTGEEFNLDGTPVSSGKKRRTDAKRYYYEVPFAQKEKAKSFGMRWDPEKKKWYSEDPNLGSFKRSVS